MIEEEMKNRISLALKDPILQQGFEIICKENAELDCQKNRNKFCYSCANATERCFKNEIGCPCEKYKSWKEENAELKEKLEGAERARDYWKDSSFDWRHKCTSRKPFKAAVKAQEQLTKAKKIIKSLLRLWNDVMTEETVKALVAEAEQFISEVEND